jgi:hypothetical protein
MVAKKESAEQKLLHMIEASSGKSPAGSSGAAKPAPKKRQKMNTLALLSLCSKGLIVLLIVSVILLVREISVGSNMQKQPIDLSMDRFEKAAFDINAYLPNWQDARYYLSVVAQRNIFKPYVPPKTTSQVVSTTQTEDSEFMRKVDKLKLVGISWMDKVETASVMIEDIDKKMTYFLQKGETLNDIIVKTIYADCAVLGYKDEEIIIRYEKSQ